MNYMSGELVQGFSGDYLPLPSPKLQPAPPDRLSSHSRNGNKVFKSGPLFISSKGIGWTSWKKRWFILTQTSLVFFRSDPNVVSQKANEVNLTLGGIDLNNSGSVSVKADKKLLTVQFPDVRDGRVFTLKAETTEDLYEWKTALENVLAHAPSANNVMGQSGILRTGQADSLDIYLDQLKDRETVKYAVLGRPILLALEEVDGTPSFLEKALRFIEEHGAKVEGILRQAADVDEVENRVREYEQGKVEFSEEEDAHVVADCVKHVLRELRSFPVPASCCKALLEACRTTRENRVSAMRAAIWDTFPEPNRRLLQRILLMMQAVASRKAENRMSSSAVAACMAPLLLRPLMVGDCEIENDFDVGGDSSIQLLQAAAAANHAQAIVITLLEEYNNIFEEGSSFLGPDMYMDSEDDESESEEVTDDDLSYDGYYDDEQDESIEGSDVYADDDIVSETNSETGDSAVNDEYDDDKDHNISYSSSKSSEVSDYLEVDQRMSTISLDVSLPQSEDVKSCENLSSQNNTACADESNKSCENFTSQNKTASANDSTKPTDINEGLFPDQNTMNRSNCSSSSSCMNKSITISNGTMHRRRTVLGRNSGCKNLSMESIDFLDENEAEVEKLEAVKTELQNQIAEEVNVNAKLQSYVETRKEALHQRCLVLERNVCKLQEQLLKEKILRESLEAGLSSPGTLSELSGIDEKTKTDLEELALIEADLANLECKVNELGVRLNAQLEQDYGSMPNFRDQTQQISSHERNLKNTLDIEVAAISEYDRSTTKLDSHFGGAENENERKTESTPSQNKHPPSSKKSATRVENRLLGETKDEIEQILTLTFENYKSLDESSFSGIVEVFRPASSHAAPALEPAVKLYKLLHDILSPEAQTAFCHYFQVAAKKRARRHLSDTDEFITQNNEGCLIDTMTTPTAYQKMKTLCINLRNEIYTDIQIHNQNILPSFVDLPNLSASIYSTELCNRLRAFLISCPPTGPSSPVAELVIATSDFQRDLSGWNINPIKGGVDAKELFHLYILVWIQDKRLSLLESCKLDKVKWSGVRTQHSTTPFVDDMYERLKETLTDYEVIICRWPEYTLVLENAIADIEKAIVEALDKQYADVLAPLKESMAPKKFGLKYVQKLAKRSTCAYVVPDEVGILLNSLKRMLDILRPRIESQFKSWGSCLPNAGNTAPGERLSEVTVMLRAKFRNYLQAIVEKLVENTKLQNATKLKKILQDSKETVVESDLKSRMQPLREQLASTISHLHTVCETHVFIAICRGYWDRMGQEILSFLENRKENRSWYKGSRVAVSVLDDTFASQMQQLLGNAIQEKDMEAPRCIMEVRSMLCKDAPNHKDNGFYY